MSTEILIDGYDDFRLIGEGGFSRDYEARQTEFERRVAVKVLTIGEGRPFDRDAFDGERRSMGVLSSHPNIVTIYDSGFTKDGKPFLTMELCELTLFDRVKRGGLLSAEEALDVGERIALALERAHAEGIVHCDIKPQNIFFSVYGEPALGDFGIAAFDEEAGGSANPRGMTVNFAAPELLRGAQPTPSSDLYALGATLYTAVTGRYPHSVQGDNSSAETAETLMVDAVLDGEPPAPITNTDIPQTLRSLILDLLSFDPAERPSSATDVVIELGEIAQGRALSGETAEPSRFARPAADLQSDDSPTIVTSDSMARGRSGPLIFAAVVLLAILGLGVFLFSSGDDGTADVATGSDADAQDQVTASTAEEAETSTSTEQVDQASPPGELAIEGLRRSVDVTQIGCTHNDTFDGGLVSIDEPAVRDSTVVVSGDNLENAAHVELRVRQTGSEQYWTGTEWDGAARSFFVPVADTWSYDLELPDGTYCVIARGRSRDNTAVDRGMTIAFTVTNSSVDALVDGPTPANNANLIITQPNGAHIYVDSPQYVWVRDDTETLEIRRADQSIVELPSETYEALLAGERVALTLEPGEYIVDARSTDRFDVHHLTVLDPREPEAS